MSTADEKLPLTTHLEELRKRLIRIILVLVVVFSACYSQSTYIFNFVTAPLIPLFPDGSSFAMLKLTEGFFTELKLSLMAAVFFSMPFILYQIWKFIAPGLYAHEKKYVVSFVIVSSLLFFSGAAFALQFSKDFFHAEFSHFHAGQHFFRAFRLRRDVGIVVSQADAVVSKTIMFKSLLP